MSQPGIVVVGSGHAGLTIAETLRRKGYQGRVRLIGAEPGLPYQRPPLSKQYLKGEWGEERLLQRNAEYFIKQNIELIPGQRATGLNPESHTLLLDSGETLEWEQLALATGSRLRRLSLPGCDAKGVHYLQTLRQAKNLRAELPDANNVVVIGAGYIGLEAAAAFALAGKRVTLLNRSSSLLKRSVTAPVALTLEKAHRDNGVAIEYGAQVAAIHEGKGRGIGVELKDGRRLPADLILVGIGVEPESQLAEEAGLICKDGILVDGQCRTSHPDILAAGDCARFIHPLFNRSVRLESIQNAVEQGKHAAASLVGEIGTYSAVPWFWSDQYSITLQLAGLSEGHDLEVIRGDEQGERYSVFCYAKRKLIAVESINAAAEHMVARRLIQQGVSPTPDDAANPDFSLRDLL